VKTEAEVLSPWSQAVSALARNWLTIGELALVAVVVHLYQIEGEPFSKVMVLTAAGFILSLVTPMAQRLPLFVALSLAAILWVFGLADGAWLIGLGLVLIALCHVPGPLALRVALLLIVGGGLAALRAGMGETPWSAMIWPIFGSMFMFRTVLYVRAVAAGQAEKGWLGALAYFFMLPNVAFPLFPVVDYQTFRRTHFDRADTAIYEQGMLWIARGILHLVLYRLVYYNVLNDPADVRELSDLVQYMLGTFLLYLRVSGQFHLIVGLLHLFGFRLPETHKLYYLAHSFTELWRRINIYWTDFMMKVVFYPAFFKLKKLGPAAGVALATGAVFFTTWILHSYQWFWLRGGFPITAPDILFWGILGALVVRGALKELKGSKAVKRASGWSWKHGLKAMTTFAAFCFLWSLWSTESVGQWVWIMGAAGRIDGSGILLLAGGLGVVFLLGGRDWEAAKAGQGGWRELAYKPATRTIAPLLMLLLAAQPALQAAFPEPVGKVLQSLQTTGLNERDAARRHRGYYEQLDVRSTLSAREQAGAGPAADWQTPAAVGIIRERNDVLSRDLYPSMRVVWNGNLFSTNSWGMRDQEYSREKPAGVLRIALLGPSHVMGNGVADGETFEAVVEERLNREFQLPGIERFEILNFGVDGHALPQQLALLEDRVLSFEPDVVIFTQYHRGKVMTERYIQKIVANGTDIPDPDFKSLLEQAGLADVPRGRFPVPFEWARAMAGALGISARMPQDEAEARSRWISEQVNDWSIARIAAAAREHGAQPLMLALNAVIDDVPEGIPNLEAVQKANVPVLNLFDVFPEEARDALRIAPWDEHPNAAGHRLIAEKLYEELAPYLARYAPAPASEPRARQPVTTEDSP
jgi:D-alanyl-lipoteichoic acid acyltransferase DltB (MBOAT superfamily)